MKTIVKLVFSKMDGSAAFDPIFAEVGPNPDNEVKIPAGAKSVFVLEVFRSEAAV